MSEDERRAKAHGVIYPELYMRSSILVILNIGQVKPGQMLRNNIVVVMVRDAQRTMSFGLAIDVALWGRRAENK